MCDSYMEPTNTEAGPPRAFVVMYQDNYRKDNGLVMLCSKGRRPLTLDEARKLAEEYTSSHHYECFIMTVIERVRLVSPVERTSFHQWNY